MRQTRRKTHVLKRGAQRPVIAVTMGDPAGVGPELCLHLLQRAEHPEGSIPIVVGDARVLDRVAQRLRVKFDVPRVFSLRSPPKAPLLLDVPDSLGGHDVAPGESNSTCGRASARFIETAVRLCLDGHASAMVTAPICKKSFRLAGVNFPGHTEMLASLVGSQRVALMLYSERIAVAFATLHQSLASVPASLTVDRTIEVGTILNRYMRLLRGGRPRLALLGLNPHAGEEGIFGDEETRILEPAVRRLRALGIQVDGPLPPDVAFTPEALDRYAGHIALYHDQGGIPFKMLAFDQGVNVTMGLGIIRTSPDHGTAFDIAWKGNVRPDSFLAAYQMAVRLAIARAKEGRHAVSALSGNATAE